MLTCLRLDKRPKGWFDITRHFSTSADASDNRFDHVVIGAGVVGLAIGARLSKHASVLVIEKNARIGEETSSRNSEVIHSGMYYPKSSLKTKYCIRGRELLYKLCSKADIPYRKVGKWVFATNYNDPRWPLLQSRSNAEMELEQNYLHELSNKCEELNIPYRWVKESEITAKEPLLRASLALEFPETGIIDSHALMNYFRRLLEENGGLLVTCSSLVESQRSSFGYRLKIANTMSTEAEPTWIETISVINSAGLHADNVSRIIMGKESPYRLYFAKGHYYAYLGNPLVSRLCYPVPPRNLSSLGVHTVVDLAGRMRFGPDIEYLPEESDASRLLYTFDDCEPRRRVFFDTVRQYLPGLDIKKISADFCGIRPKLAAEGGPFCDFVVHRERRLGHEGLINLIGIESPGLTSSMAIAEEIASMLGYPSEQWF